MIVVSLVFLLKFLSNGFYPNEVELAANVFGNIVLCVALGVLLK